MKNRFPWITSIKDALIPSFKRNVALGDGKVSYTFSPRLFYLTGKLVGKKKGTRPLGNQPLPIENQLVAAHQEAAHKELGELIQEEATLKANIKSGLYATDQFDMAATLERVDAEFAERRDQLKTRKEEDLQRIQDKLDEAKGEEGLAKAETESEAQALGAPRHAKRVSTGGLQQVVVGIIACALEYASLFLVSEKLFRTNLYMAVATAFVGLLPLVAGSKLLGKFLYRAFKDSRIGVAVALFSLTGVVLATGVGMGLTRLASEGKGATEEAIGFFFLSLSVAFPIVLAWMSYNFHSKYQPLRARHFNALQENLKVITTKVNTLDEELQKQVEAYRVKEDGLHAEFQEAVTKIRLHTTELMTRVVADQEKLAQIPKEMELIPYLYSAQANESIYAARTYLMMHTESTLDSQPTYFGDCPTSPEDFMILNNKGGDVSDMTEEVPVSNNGHSRKERISILPMILLALGVSLLSITSCANTHKAHVIEMLQDKTEGHDLAQLDGAALLAPVGVDTGSGDAYPDQIMVNFQTIQDVSRSSITSLTLDASSAGENRYVRAEEVVAFVNDIDALVNITDTTKRNQSHIYQPMCESLMRLSQVPKGAGERILVVSSDLLEATQHVSMYGSQNFADPATLRTKLEKCGCVLPRLDGISIYLLHQPTVEDDERSTNAKKFYGTWLTEKGAKVIQAANL